jgi:glycosyltransferase involved in cell wall biosynthesis
LAADRDREFHVSRVDVFVPCYNYGRFLRRCVESVLTQTGVDVRVLILDDSSTDNSEEIGRQLAADDSRVEYRRHPANRGHIATYNEGIEWASGEYTLLLSADDALTPGSLRRAARLMDAHADVSFVHGQSIRTSDPCGEVCPQAGDCATSVVRGPDFFRSLCETGQNVVETPTAVVRTTVHKRVGGYRTELPHAGDMELWLRLALHGNVGYVHGVQAFYRLHGKNMSTAFQQVRDLKQRRDVFRILFQEYPDRIPHREQLRHTATVALAQDAFWSAATAFDRGDTEVIDDYLAFAAEIHPRIQSSWAWRRLQAKRAMGTRLWKLLRRPVRGLRASLANRA